jgi:hypothetical protein
MGTLGCGGVQTVQSQKCGAMRSAVYNSAIPDVILNTVNRAFPSILRIAQLFFVVMWPVMIGQAADWNGPEQQLARKIVAVTGPGAVALTVENRSSLGKRDSEIIQNGVHVALEALGLRFVKPEQAAATVAISLSENSMSYVWVAEIRQGTGDAAVVLVSAPRPEGPTTSRDSVPLTLSKIPLWTQDDPILDVSVLEESSAPTLIAVLDPNKISLYRQQRGKWQLQQELPITHQRPWPRDLRGRLVPARDHWFDVYLPGAICASGAASAPTLNCHDSEDPWPLISGTLNGGAAAFFPSAGLASGASTVVPQMKAFFAPTRNFFTGVLTPGTGKFTTVPKFYSGALLPREKYILWLFATTDGQTHLIDGVSDQVLRLGWGSDLASVRTACGAGWQVLSSSPDQVGDSVRAYEFPDRDPVAVSPAIDFSGPVTALWTESRGDTAIAVARNRETGSYEAYRLAMACGQ